MDKLTAAVVIGFVVIGLVCVSAAVFLGVADANKPYCGEVTCVVTP